MSSSHAMHYAHLARDISTSDSDRMKNLVEAVYNLAQAVQNLETRIRRFEDKK